MKELVRGIEVVSGVIDELFEGYGVFLLDGFDMLVISLFNDIFVAADMLLIFNELLVFPWMLLGAPLPRELLDGFGSKAFFL